MTLFQQNTESLIGLFLLLTSILTCLFPPKFGNVFYGVTTKLTVKNETIWAAHQQQNISKQQNKISTLSHKTIQEIQKPCCHIYLD